jgi:hypothetical protein
MNYLDKDELLSRLGLEVTPSLGRTAASAIATFGAGLLVGAGLALLLAPTSGRALRAELGKSMPGNGVPGHAAPHDGAVTASGERSQG